MGSKGLKAVVVDDQGARLKEPVRVEEFGQWMREFSKVIRESPLVKSYKTYGTAALVEITNALGGLPTRNFRTGKFEGAEKISGERLHDVIEERGGKVTHSCMPGCAIKCSNVFADTHGQEVVSPIEYETIALMGANLCIDDLDTIARLNYLCNDYGLDTIETGAALGIAMEAGIIAFGDQNGAINLVNEIGKGSLLGRVIGMGAATAGKVLGVTNLPVVKGQAMPGYEPRAIKGVGVTYATSPMGADHTAGATARVATNHSSSVGQVELSRKMQYSIPLYDLLGLCMLASGAIGAHPEMLCKLVSAQVGKEFNVDDLFGLAAKTIEWEREFNRRAGFTKQHDRLPHYFSEVPNPAVATTFDITDLELDKVHADHHTLN